MSQGIFRGHYIHQLTQVVLGGMKLNKLIDMTLNNLISEEIYQFKKEEITKELNSVKTEIEIHDLANDDFKNLLITAFYLASKSYDLFICSKTEEKRQLINFVFSNISLRGDKLDYTLRKPFDLMVNLSQQPTWLPQLPQFLTNEHHNITNFYNNNSQIFKYLPKDFDVSKS